MQHSVISKVVGTVFAMALAVAATAVLAEDANDTAGGYGYGYTMGPGMMWGGGGYGGYGMGPGIMGGYGPGYGMMGPGMMWGGGGYGGYGIGPGMGMMGGMMGPGMMGGYGMGPGMMMGYGSPYGLDLSAEQRAKINKILDGERKQHWSVMGKMMDELAKLRDLYETDQPDPKKVGVVYGAISKLQQQMLETHVQANNEMRNVLTKEQREELRQCNRGGGGWGPRGPAAGQGGPMGPGNAPGGMMGR